MRKGIALNIGINRVDGEHYAGWAGPLVACEADAEDVNAIAKALGYGCQLLLSQQASREAVVAAVKQAAVSLTAGDIFLLSYSGHGGQVPDLDGDEPDLQDETWCLYDGQLIDDELRELWARFAQGVRILVLSDSCHSGSVTRAAYDELRATGVVARPVSGPSGDERPVFRVMPDEAALRTYRINRDFYRSIAAALPKPPSPVTATVRLLSGCQDNQLSLDGTFNGLFTGTLLRVWNDGTFAGNYRVFHHAILQRMPPTQSPNHLVVGPPNVAYDEQKPFQI